MKKKIHVLYDDPIVFGHVSEPEQQPPATSDGNAGPLVLLIGGSIVALLCLWWLAPEWLAAAWKNLINQMFRLAGQ